MRWVVVHDGWDEYVGYYRTFYVRPGYFSDKEAKKLSWLKAKLIARTCTMRSTNRSDKYFVKRIEAEV